MLRGLSTESIHGDPVAGSLARRWSHDLPLLLGGIAVLGIAMWLDPDPAGHGTHTQLGLAGCTFLTVTGWPCPMCGATTAFALMADLRPLAAFATQPFAAVLFLLTVGCVGVAGAELIRPAGRWHRLGDALDRHALWVGSLGLAALSAAWIWKIAQISQAA